jgi:hypothetical protein
MADPIHPAASFWLDIADKLIKLAAVLIGGLWTWWNFRKSRTYEQKLELEVLGHVFLRSDLYGDIKVVLKNIGDTKHNVQHTGTYCVLSIIRTDLIEEDVQIFPVFETRDRIEPGECIDDTRFWCIEQPVHDIVWVKLRLRVVSNGVEWHTSGMIRVDHDEPASTTQDEVT